MVSELSILIPVHNRDVQDLVQSLVRQVATLSIPVEIRVYDDGSQLVFKSFNQSISSSESIIYKKLPVNVGRSQIRYLLAQEARYSTLLFLDNDVLPVHADFLATYLSAHSGTVTVGGIAYHDKPSNPELELRWIYGKEREQAKAAQRQKNPYDRVFLSNLLVERHLFLEHFKEDVVMAYGHEDTLFADLLQQHQVKVVHIDNPVYHLGLDTAENFMCKTELALKNLLLLRKSGWVHKEGKLLKMHDWLGKLGVLSLLRPLHPWVLRRLKNRLISPNPSLRVFDLYRLLLLDQIQRA
ncbi:glycosyltransferase [Nibribacter ruber]|uniref:Glycosyltransferase n=1 Tax=Nibribacter ruber TaxID=2698458 RepID=A0A6P1NVV9_9BACT|nr:glycosyltransferase [Nibribacter ruber]QHL86118.1 glycosyltransferase [Nibribacter ruber]